MEWVLLVLATALVAWLLIAYAALVDSRRRVVRAFDAVAVLLEQRHDLIPSLITTVKRYAGHERGAIEPVAQAHNAALSAQGSNQRTASEGVLQDALGRLIALGDAHPALQADADFRMLQAHLNQIEGELTAARRTFNNTVAEYDEALGRIPAVWFAKVAGFQRYSYFDVGETQRVALDTSEP